jgi:hypothetical protein
VDDALLVEANPTLAAAINAVLVQNCLRVKQLRRARLEAGSGDQWHAMGGGEPYKDAAVHVGEELDLYV